MHECKSCFAVISQERQSASKRDDKKMKNIFMRMTTLALWQTHTHYLFTYKIATMELLHLQWHKQQKKCIVDDDTEVHQNEIQFNNIKMRKWQHLFILWMKWVLTHCNVQFFFHHFKRLHKAPCYAFSAKCKTFSHEILLVWCIFIATFLWKSFEILTKSLRCI